MDGGYDYSHFAVKGTEKQFVELNAYSVAGIPIPAERPTAGKPETRGLCSSTQRSAQGSGAEGGSSICQGEGTSSAVSLTGAMGCGSEASDPLEGMGQSKGATALKLTKPTEF